MGLMKKHGNKFIVVLLILLVITLFSYIKVSIDNRNFNEKLSYEGEDYVTLQLQYNGYACGDCYPEYRVSKVIENGNKEISFYLNKDINIEYENSMIREKLKLPNCFTKCFTINVSGNLQSNQYGMLRLVVKSGSINIDTDCCNKK